MHAHLTPHTHTCRSDVPARTPYPHTHPCRSDAAARSGDVLHDATRVRAAAERSRERGRRRHHDPAVPRHPRAQLTHPLHRVQVRA